MFGYVTINKPELKIKDFEKYQSYYCGLCHALNDSYGLFGRITLNYDMTFLIMLLSDLYEEEEKVSKKRCIVHPLSKHTIRRTSITEYCSDMTILLTYYKVLDDWNDDHKLKAKLAMAVLKRKAKRAIKRYPDKAATIEKELNMLTIVESAKNESLDRVAMLFGRIMGEVFAYKNDYNRDNLYKVGFFLGKFVYLMDAFEDVEKDIESGSYNPFKELFKNSPKESFNRQIYDILVMMISECTDAFERLPLINNSEILRNILYSGVWTRFELVKEEREKKDNGSV